MYYLIGNLALLASDHIPIDKNHIGTSVLERYHKKFDRILK